MEIRVRPAVRWTGRIVLPILLVVAAWQVWDNVERKRLDGAYAPLTGWDIGLSSGAPTNPSQRNEEQAGRFYAAAAILAVSSTADQRFQEAYLATRQREAITGGRPLTAEELEGRDQLLARNEPVTALVEHGSNLRFHTLPQGGLVTNYRMNSMINAARAESLRSLRLLEQGDTVAAAAGIEAHLHLLRGFDLDGFGAGQKAVQIVDAASNTGLLISKRVSAEELRPLRDAFAGVYADWEPTAVVFGFARSRYDFVQAVRSGQTWQYGPWGTPLQPLIAHGAVGAIRLVGRVMEAAKQPWPTKLDAVDKFARPDERVPTRPPFLLGFEGWLSANYFPRLMREMADGVAASRAAITAIAIQEYTERAGQPPSSLSNLQGLGDAASDPFTGQPLHYVHDDAGFVVYSVGRDRKDDGGKVDPQTKTGSAPGFEGPRPDVGVRVRYSR